MPVILVILISDHGTAAERVVGYLFDAQSVEALA